MHYSFILEKSIRINYKGHQDFINLTRLIVSLALGGSGCLTLGWIWSSAKNTSNLLSAVMQSV